MMAASGRALRDHLRVALTCVALSGANAWAATGTHYELSLKPDFAAQALDGRARVRLDAAPALGEAVAIASPALTITRARMNGRDVPFVRTAEGWRVDSAPGSGGADHAWLDVEYRAPAGAGLVFGAAHVYTAFHTCQWMPCVGSDLDRAGIALVLELPGGYRSVASGERLADDGTGRARWLERRPFALYTFGFAAGRFTEAVDVAEPVRLRYLGVDVDPAGLRARFKDTAQMVKFFTDKAGLPLPNPEYTQVLVPGGVAQEASSFALIGRRVLDPILEDPEEDWAIAHELAHQWWGNLVTCATWNELWLNEGVTVFMTAAWKQHRWGEAAYRRELDLARARWQRAKEADFDRPLNWSGTYPSLAVRRAIQYSKGALFLDALRSEVGERAFWDGLRRYTRAHAGGSVRANDLQAAMEAEARRTLQPLFAAWVY